MTRDRLMLVAAGLVALLSGGWLLQRGAHESSTVYERARLLDNIIVTVADNYVDSLDVGRLYDMAVDGMLEALDDPYADLLSPDEIADLLESTQGDYVGLGIRVEMSDGWVTIVTPLAETPAEEAGIRAGDRILRVDGVSTAGWSSDNAVKALRGDSGTSAMLVLARAGSTVPLTFRVERARIHVTSVQHQDLVDSAIGYVHLETVSAQSAAEVGAAVAALRDRGARSLVLDLRFNPGGLLDQGIAVTDLFLPEEAIVVTTRGRSSAMSRTYRADSPERWSAVPLIVLVNEFTASAAEIIAGALQDHDRALVLGEPTFGKGVVQGVFQVSRTEALRLTTSRWFTPSGRSIQRGERDSRIPNLDEGEMVVSPEFRTFGGRVLVGGGGIHPDVVATPDGPMPGEPRLQIVLGAKVQIYRDVLASYARDFAAAGLSNPSDVTVTAAMRRQVFDMLGDRDVVIPQEIWLRAGDAVSRDLRNMVLRYGFGRDEEVRQRLRDDPVVQHAVRLLREVTTQQELLAPAPAAGVNPASARPER